MYAETIDQAFAAAALISSAPSKFVPCSLPRAPATHASATLSLDTGGDSATCSKTAYCREINRSKNRATEWKYARSKETARKTPGLVEDIATASAKRRNNPNICHELSSCCSHAHAPCSCSADWCDRTGKLHSSRAHVNHTYAVLASHRVDTLPP